MQGGHGGFYAGRGGEGGSLKFVSGHVPPCLPIATPVNNNVGLQRLALLCHFMSFTLRSEFTYLWENRLGFTFARNGS